MTQTAGQALTAEIRRMFQIGPRTRSSRNTGRSVRHDELVKYAFETIGAYRGSESDRRTAVLDAGHTAFCAYFKFIGGYRIDGVLRYRITTMTPWAFTAFLGEMVDSGCANMGEFETWFAAQARQVRGAA